MSSALNFGFRVEDTIGFIGVRLVAREHPLAHLFAGNMRRQGLGFGVYDSRVMVEDLGFIVECLVFSVQCLVFSVSYLVLSV